MFQAYCLSNKGVALVCAPWNLLPNFRQYPQEMSFSAQFIDDHAIRVSHGKSARIKWLSPTPATGRWSDLLTAWKKDQTWHLRSILNSRILEINACYLFAWNRCIVPRWRYEDTGPQPEGGNRAIAPQKFLKTYVFVTYSNKLHHFAPPENIGWLRPCADTYFFEKAHVALSGARWTNSLLFLINYTITV